MATPNPDTLFVTVCRSCGRQTSWDQRDRLTYGWFHANTDRKCKRGQYLAAPDVQRIEVVPAKA